MWTVSVAGRMLYERSVTIGFSEGPWMHYRNYEGLVFYRVQLDADHFSFWLQEERFWATLLLPLVVLWAIAVFLVPVVRWVASGRQGSYVSAGRLADVLAMIQVLALDEHSHRSESGLAGELQGPARSAGTWSEVAERHPEFFRVKPTGENRISLIARHVSAPTGEGRPPLTLEHTSKLMQIAIEMHDRQLRRSQAWHIWIPVVVAVTAGVFTLFGIWEASSIGV